MLSGGWPNYPLIHDMLLVRIRVLLQQGGAGALDMLTRRKQPDGNRPQFASERCNARVRYVESCL